MTIDGNCQVGLGTIIGHRSLRKILLTSIKFIKRFLRKYLDNNGGRRS